MTTRTSSTTSSPAPARRRSLSAAAALLSASALVLTACTVTPGEDPSQSPTTSPASSGQGTSTGGEGSSASADPSGSSGAGTGGSDAEPLSLDELGAALITAEQFPVATEVTRDDQQAQGQPFTMYLNLNGFTATGDCATVLERINSFEAPQASAVVASYTTNLTPAESSGTGATGGTATSSATPTASASPGASSGQTTPTVEMMAVSTQSPVDAMSVYSEVPEVCGTLKGDKAPAATARFEKLTVGEGIHAVVLRIDSGFGQEQTLTIGGLSAGRNHLYSVMSLVDPADAQQILTTQAEQFRKALDSPAS